MDENIENQPVENQVQAQVESQKRITAYIPESEHRKLRSNLVLKGLSISEWLRQAVAEYLSKLP